MKRCHLTRMAMHCLNWSFSGQKLVRFCFHFLQNAMGDWNGDYIYIFFILNSFIIIYFYLYRFYLIQFFYFFILFISFLSYIVLLLLFCIHIVSKLYSFINIIIDFLFTYSFLVPIFFCLLENLI